MRARSRGWMIALVLTLVGCASPGSTVSSSAAPASSSAAPASSAASPKAVAKGETIRVVTYGGNFTALPVTVGTAKGFFADHGLKVEEVSAPNSNVSLTGVISGSIDISYVSTDSLMTAFAKGAAIQVIAGDVPAPIFTIEFLAGVPTPNLAAGYPKVMQDLKGLRFGVSARGSSQEILMRALFAGAGMPEESVTYVAVGGTAPLVFAAFQAKQIDAALTNEPVQTLCKVSKVCVPVLDLRNGEGPAEIKDINGAWQGYYAATSYIAAHPVVIDAFIQALQESMKWMQEPANSKELFQIAQKTVQLGAVPNPDQVLNDMLTDNVRYFSAKMSRSGLTAQMNFLIKHGSLDKPIDLNTFLYPKAPQ